MRAALALLSMTGGKEVTIQQRQGHESHAFLLPFGGNIRVVERSYPRRRLLKALPLDLNPELIVYRVMAKDFSKESLPTVEIRRLRPYSTNEREVNEQEPDQTLAHRVENLKENNDGIARDRASTRRGSVQLAIESRLAHVKHVEDETEVLARQQAEMHEKGWKWLETLLKVNRNTNTCLIILTLRPRRLHEILHGHRQVRLRMSFSVFLKLPFQHLPFPSSSAPLSPQKPNMTHPPRLPLVYVSVLCGGVGRASVEM